MSAIEAIVDGDARSSDVDAILDAKPQAAASAGTSAVAATAVAPTAAPVAAASASTSTTTTPTLFPASFRSGKASPVARFEGYNIVVNGLLYVMGGFDANFRTVPGIDVYNPASNTWHRIFNGRIKPAETHAGVAVDGAAIYFAGGFAGNLEPGRRQPISNSLWRFDTNTRRWTRLASLPRGQGAGTMVVLNRELHFFGGCTADRVTNTGLHWVFGLGKSSSIRDDGHRWVRKATMPGARDHLAGITMNGKIYAIGGEFGHDVRHIQSNLVQCFDPKTNQWTLCARLPVPKSHIEWGTFALDGKIVVAGGQVTPQLPTRDVEMFYPDHNRWAELTSLPSPRQGVAVQKIGDRVVITVGGVHTNEPQRSTWLGKLRYAANGSTTPPATASTASLKTASASASDLRGNTHTASSTRQAAIDQRLLAMQLELSDAAGKLTLRGPNGKPLPFRCMCPICAAAMGLYRYK